nr:probable thiopurine S-methyltransferase [Lytechinus pictus]
MWGLAEEGHEVVGVEGVLQAVMEFFQEQDLSYKESDIPGVKDGKLFENEDKKIKIYLCDFFKFSKYTDVLLSVLSPGGRILNEVYEYSREEKPKGSPNTVPDEVIQKLYGEKFSIELLADNDHMNQHFKDQGLTWMRQHVRIMTLK